MIDETDTTPSDRGRRAAIATILGVAVSIGAGWLGLVGAFLGNALRPRADRSWLSVGRAEDLDVTAYRKRVLYVEVQDAWTRKRTPVVVYVRDRYPDDPIALLATCSHLGCSVSWDARDERFRCPCHGGTYDANGAVVSGPPPRPLTRLEVKIENDDCYVRLPRDRRSHVA